MKKKWFSILLAGALSVAITGTAFASRGESEGDHSGGSSDTSKSGYSQSSDHRSDGWGDREDGDKQAGSHDNHGPKGQNSQQFNFHDMGESAWAEPYVMKLLDNDVVKGYPDGSFKPNQPVTRAEVVTMVARSQNAPQGTGQTTYVDAPSWACDYVNWAVGKQILIPGEDNYKLEAEDPATRLWVAQMAVRALGLDAQATVAQNTYLPFNDSSAVPDDMAGYVKLATEKGIFTGYPDCTFQPHKPITRAEMSVIASRLNAAMNNDTIGAVTAADAGSVTLSVYGGASQTIEVASGATVWLNNSPATTKDLQQGDVVEVDLNAAGKAVVIDATRIQQAPVSVPAPAPASTPAPPLS